MKKFLAMVLSLAMVSSLSVPVFAADGDATAPKLGEVTVNVTKEWKNDVEENRPGNITVNVGDKKVVLSSENGWEGSVVVDAFDTDGKLKNYAVSEDAVENYTTEIDPETLEMQGFAEFTVLDKVPNCETTKKYLDGYNMAVFKKGDGFVVWTVQELTEGAQKALVPAIEQSKAYEGNDLADMSNVSFADGYGTFSLIGQDVTISDNGTITFENKSTWSWFYRGNVAMAQDEYDVTVTNTYTAPEEPDGPKYEWVQTGSDSATGYDPNNKIVKKGTWFMYNAVPELAVNESETFDIQAGNDKNGTHFVGTYTVTKTDENEYKISYEINGLDDTHKIQFDDAKLWVNGTGIFTTSPGNQKGNATAVYANEAFKFDGNTLYIFAHFDVSYWEKVPVDVAE